MLDADLPAMRDVGSLLAVLVKPPKPKKLAEEIRTRGELEALANVTVHDRRVTPIDKDKTAGRWKVMVQELEKRDLPVTGKGPYGKTVEVSWADGGLQTLRKANYWKRREKWERGERRRPY